MANRMDTLVSKTKGVAKGVKARIDGLHGVFATLAKQHGEAASLLDAVVSDKSKREDLWPTIRETLLAHEKSEMQELYPVLRSLPETTRLAERHDAEAKEMETMIERLDAMNIQSAEWGVLFERLADTVKYHAVQEEEKRIFPVAQDAIGETRAKEIDEKFQATFEKLMKLH